MKDVFPDVPLLNYCEFYYNSPNGDANFDPEEPLDIDGACKMRARNAHLLLSLETCDWGVSPTHFQKSQHPEVLQSKISVIFEGIDTNLVKPDPNASFTLPNGRVLTRNDEVITYVTRNLEPYRGFRSFMRAIPEICRRRPNAQIVLLGGDDVS